MTLKARLNSHGEKTDFISLMRDSCMLIMLYTLHLMWSAER